MYYPGLRRLANKERRRAISGLQRLRQQLSEEIPDKDAENSLLLATWNIRDLTKTKSRRLTESLYYIAEIISHFDFVAVQEVNGLEEWNRIMSILGREWDVIATDEADRKAGGNGERLTYVFDKRKVRFENIAGELVLPQSDLISQVRSKKSGKEIVAGRQFSRTPFVAMFQAGWFKFSICTVHIYFGDDSGVKLQRRIEEIAAVAKYFGQKAGRVLRQEGRTLILLGDFNIVSPEHKTMQALEDNKFVIPSSLRDKPANQNRTRHYDQIAFRASKKVLDFIDEQCDSQKKCNSGVFDPYESVFQLSDEDSYAKEKGDDKRLFKTWRSYQISDHLPMWVRLDVNDSDEYLNGLK